MPSHFWENVFEDHALPQQAAFPRARSQWRRDLSLCLLRLHSGPASRPLGTMGRVSSNSEGRGCVGARPLRSLAHPQAIDAKKFLILKNSIIKHNVMKIYPYVHF